MSLAGCAKGKFATVEAFCDELPSAQYAVRGATEYDQAVIDDTTEAVVAGCDRERPRPRPPGWDDPPAPLPAPRPVKAAPKPRTIMDLLRRRSAGG